MKKIIKVEMNNKGIFDTEFTLVCGQYGMDGDKSKNRNLYLMQEAIHKEYTLLYLFVMLA